MNKHIVEIPKAYLSTSGGAWRVIENGSPICVDKPTRQQAEAAAKQMNVTPTALWNGDLGTFENL